MKQLRLLFILCLVCSCGKENPPTAPDPSTLIFPTQNLECTQGELLNGVTRKIPFQWGVATGAESYELHITQLSNGAKTIQRTQLTNLEVPLATANAYSWKVVASNTKVLETTDSALWYFFNAGSETTHAPFPASALSPLSGSQLSMPVDGRVSIRWSGADIDNDIVRYELFFGTQNPPTTPQNLSGNTTTQFTASVSAGQTYYWQVLSTDQAGNETPSAVFDFKIKE